MSSEHYTKKQSQKYTKSRSNRTKLNKANNIFCMTFLKLIRKVLAKNKSKKTQPATYKKHPQNEKKNKPRLATLIPFLTSLHTPTLFSTLSPTPSILTPYTLPHPNTLPHTHPILSNPPSQDPQHLFPHFVALANLPSRRFNCSSGLLLESNS